MGPSGADLPRWYRVPEYGPLAPTEDTLHLLELTPDLRALELGGGSGHSLRYLAERGACELWGLDLSPVEIAFAEETLRPFAERVRLIASPMEVNPGMPRPGGFGLVFRPVWKGVPIVIQHRLGTVITEVAASVDPLVTTPDRLIRTKSSGPGTKRARSLPDERHRRQAEHHSRFVIRAGTNGIPTRPTNR